MRDILFLLVCKIARGQVSWTFLYWGFVIAITVARMNEGVSHLKCENITSLRRCEDGMHTNTHALGTETCDVTNVWVRATNLCILILQPLSPSPYPTPTPNPFIMFPVQSDNNSLVLLCYIANAIASNVYIPCILSTAIFEIKFINLSIYLSINLFIYLSFYLSIHLSNYISIFLSIERSKKSIGELTWWISPFSYGAYT